MSGNRDDRLERAIEMRDTRAFTDILREHRQCGHDLDFQIILLNLAAKGDTGAVKFSLAPEKDAISQQAFEDAVAGALKRVSVLPSAKPEVVEALISGIKEEERGYFKTKSLSAIFAQIARSGNGDGLPNEAVAAYLIMSGANAREAMKEQVEPLLRSKEELHRTEKAIDGQLARLNLFSVAMGLDL